MTLIIDSGFLWNESVWNPSMISTALWLDAADSTTLFTTDTGSTLATNGSAVGRWNDKSGNGRNITQGGSSTSPTNTNAGLNGKNVITFNGVNNMLFAETLGLSGLSSVTILTVTRYITGTAEDMIMGVGTIGSVAGVRAFYRGNGRPEQGFAGWAREITVSAYSCDIGGSFHIFGIWNTALSGAGNVTISRDGLSTAYSTDPLVNTADGFSVGALQGGGFTTYSSNIDVAEVIVLPVSVSTDILRRIEGYLAHKWGLTTNLPSDHPYKIAAPVP